METKKILKAFISALFCLALINCGHIPNNGYRQVSPIKYKETEFVKIIEFKNKDIDEVYRNQFSEYIIIGEFCFDGPYEDPGLSDKFAKSLGAEVMIATTQYSGVATGVREYSTPTESRTNFNGNSGGMKFSGEATTRGTQTHVVPVIFNTYNQCGKYLRK